MASPTSTCHADALFHSVARLSTVRSLSCAFPLRRASSSHIPGGSALFFARSALSRLPLPSAPLPVSSRAHCAAVAARALLCRATRALASSATHPSPSQSPLPSLALLLLSTLLCPSLPISPLPPPPFSPHLLQLVRACGALFPQTRPFTILLLSSLPLTPLPLVFLHLFSLPICCSCIAADYLATIPPPLVSPLSGAAEEYFANIPPPLVSPLSGAAAEYSAAIPPPLVSPLSGAAADYSANIPPLLVYPLSGAAADYSSTIPPPLVSPLSGTAADYSTTIPPPLVSPLSGTAADSFALIPPPLIPLPLSALQLSPPPYGDLSCPPLPPSAGPGSGAIPKPASAPTSTSSDPYADGLRAAIAETGRIAATAQATAAAAPDNATARDLARVLAESLESTRKCLT
ncbi:unnamed protein product [Closterium sp. NIES-65]|nr:unnamed protein product [Closterium sp. NIES-65]